MGLITLILIYIGLLALAVVITYFVDEGIDYRETNGGGLLISHLIGWFLLLIISYHSLIRPQYDYKVELNTNQTVTVITDEGTYIVNSLEDLEEFIENDNL